MINKDDRRGGAARVAYDLKQGLENRGQVVDFFVHNKETKDKHTHLIADSKLRFALSHLAGTDINFFKTDYLLQTEAFKQADIIHCHNLHGHYFSLDTLLKMSQLKPIVWTLHDLWAVTPYCSQAPRKSLVNGFYTCPINSSRSIMKYFNQIYLSHHKRQLYKNLSVNLVAPSLWLKNKLTNSVLADKPVSLIHHGVDLDNFYPEDKLKLRRQLALPLDKKIVLFVASGGKDNLWKGWSYAEEVIKRFKNRPDVLFLCIGGVSGQTDSANLKFVDYLDSVELLAKYFKTADAFMLTSVAESFALVILEAMAAGLPVVSFEVGVASEVVQHQVNGYLAKYLDSQDLALGLDYVLGLGPSALSNILKFNQVVLQSEFSLPTMVDNYLKLYQKLIG